MVMSYYSTCGGETPPYIFPKTNLYKMLTNLVLICIIVLMAVLASIKHDTSPRYKEHWVDSRPPICGKLEERKNNYQIIQDLKQRKAEAELKAKDKETLYKSSNDYKEYIKAKTESEDLGKLLGKANDNDRLVTYMLDELSATCMNETIDTGPRPPPKTTGYMNIGNKPDTNVPTDANVSPTKLASGGFDTNLVIKKPVPQQEKTSTTVEKTKTSNLKDDIINANIAIKPLTQAQDIVKQPPIIEKPAVLQTSPEMLSDNCCMHKDLKIKWKDCRACDTVNLCGSKDKDNCQLLSKYCIWDGSACLNRPEYEHIAETTACDHKTKTLHCYLYAPIQVAASS